MAKLHLHNNLSRKKEEFKPLLENQVRLYTCGPTVYNYAHIGNLRAYVFADILCRTLRYNYGEKNVTWAMNITDVDDKTIRDSKIYFPELEPMEALKMLTAKYEDIFWNDLRLLNVKMPDKIMRAADAKYILQMQELVKSIYEKGYAYIKAGSVYFNVKKYGENYTYGRLVEIDISKMKIGASIDADEYEKESAQDFVLWKGKKAGEPFWDFALAGEDLGGRPGWHIECSAMGEAELGTPFDIHTGGIDLKFPHHENEIAQSTIGYAASKPVNFWMHNEHLLIDNMRMGKRFKNFYTTKDFIEKGYKPLVYRFYCLQTNYGKQMNFTWDGLKAAQDGLEHLYNQVRAIFEEKDSALQKNKNYTINPEYKNKFLAAINDDLNTAQALAILQELLKSNMAGAEKLGTISDFDKVLGLDLLENALPSELPENINELKLAREKARAEKNWAESDRLRDRMEAAGYIVEDLPDGMRVIKK